MVMFGVVVGVPDVLVDLLGGGVFLEGSEDIVVVIDPLPTLILSRAFTHYIQNNMIEYQSTESIEEGGMNFYSVLEIVRRRSPDLVGLGQPRFDVILLDFSLFFVLRY